MFFTNNKGKRIDKAYLEGYQFLSSLEDYWFELTINEDEVQVRCLYDLMIFGLSEEITQQIKNKTINGNIDGLHSEPNFYSEQIRLIK